MDDPAEPKPATRSSLLYAMGRLQALNETQSSQIAELPERVFERINPRLAAVETRGDGFETRIRALERWRWILLGGGVVVAWLVGQGGVPLLHLKV